MTALKPSLESFANSAAPQHGLVLPWILLIDDHALFRAGMQLILGDGAEKLGLTLEAGSLQQALSLPHDIALVLLDIELPGLNGLEGLALLRRRWPKAALVMLSAHDNSANVKLALERGALAFVNKAASPQHIRRVVSQALRGQGEMLQDSLPAAQDEAARAQETPSKSTAALSVRQLDVLALLCEGMSNKAIANRLGLAENTVRNHLVAVMRHFDASTRTEVVMAAQRLGVVKVQA
jgi:DNA-binding NarL/FixJ family response regulator